MPLGFYPVHINTTVITSGSMAPKKEQPKKDKVLVDKVHASYHELEQKEADYL